MQKNSSQFDAGHGPRRRPSHRSDHQPDKREGLLELGADEVILLSDDDQLKDRASSIDFILSTIPTAFDMKLYITLLKHDGALVSVGMLEGIEAEAINFAEVSSSG